MIKNNANVDAIMSETVPELSERERNLGNASVSNGLENVIAADTALSRVDGERGRLIIRGRLVEDLAGAVPFEGTCRLLWTGDATDRTPK